MATTLAASAAAAEDVPQRCGKLPAAVAKTRQAIHDAAAARDYAALAKLADAENFTFSFGDDTDPVAYWKSADAEGTDIRATLVALLDMPCVSATDENGQPFYEWPSAAEIAFAELTKDEVAALKRLYDGDLEQYWVEGTDSGYYVGWRLSIDKDGRWVDFVAGD
jgi:hypothetical protein